MGPPLIAKDPFPVVYADLTVFGKSLTHIEMFFIKFSNYSGLSVGLNIRFLGPNVHFK